MLKAMYRNREFVSAVVLASALTMLLGVVLCIAGCNGVNPFAGLTGEQKAEYETEIQQLESTVQTIDTAVAETEGVLDTLSQGPNTPEIAAQISKLQGFLGSLHDERVAILAATQNLKTIIDESGQLDGKQLGNTITGLAPLTGPAAPYVAILGLLTPVITGIVGSFWGQKRVRSQMNSAVAGAVNVVDSVSTVLRELNPEVATKAKNRLDELQTPGGKLFVSAALGKVMDPVISRVIKQA